MVEIPIERQSPLMRDERVKTLKLLVRELPEIIMELEHVQHWTISETRFADEVADILEQRGVL